MAKMMGCMVARRGRRVRAARSAGIVACLARRIMTATEATDVSTSPAPPIEALSPAEERFERWRKSAGFFLAPLVFLVILLSDFPALSPQAHRLAAVMAAVVTLWITESLPMPATALLGA